MSVIDTIVADYKARKEQHIDISEWQQGDGKPLRIYWNLLTVDERKKFSAPGRTDVDVFAAMARDETGELLFSKEDKPKLKMSADASIITRVALAMIGRAQITDEEIEDTVKN